MDPLLGAGLGVLTGGIKSIIEGILHRQAVVRAAKANMFAFGGRPAVPYPDAAPSPVGNIVSGAATGASLAQSLQNSAAQQNLLNAQADAVRSPNSWAEIMSNAPQSSSQLGLDYSMPNSQSLLKKILMGE